MIDVCHPSFYHDSLLNHIISKDFAFIVTAKYCCHLSFIILCPSHQNARYERTLLALQNLSPPPVIQATDEVMVKINEAVRAHFHNIYHDFKEADFASIGSVTREDFREVLNKNVMRVNDEQVNQTRNKKTLFHYFKDVFKRYILFTKLLNTCFFLYYYFGGQVGSVYSIDIFFMKGFFNRI